MVEDMYNNMGSPLSFKMILDELTGNPRRPIVLDARDAVAKALRALVSEGRLVAIHQAKGEALCMSDLSNVEEYLYAPCTSQEASKYCSPWREPGGGLLCRPKPPKECPRPEWNPASKSWRCRRVEEGEAGGIEEETAKTKPSRRRARPSEISLHDVNIAELERDLRERVDLNLEVIDADLEVSMKVKPENSRPAMNLVLLALDELATKASKSYKVEIRLLLNIDQDTARGTIDLTFSDTKRMKNVAPGMVQLVASIAREVEVTVQLTLKSLGERTLKIEDVVNAFKRARLIGVPSLVIRNLDIVVDER